MCMKRYLLLDDGLAPGISEKHSLITWLRKHPAIGHLFLGFQVACVCGVYLTKNTSFVPNSHLIYNQTTSLQQESSTPQEKIIISNVLNTRVVSLYIFFPFPTGPPGSQLWITGNKFISSLNIHQLELHESWRQTVGGPALGPRPSQCRERTPLRWESVL